MKMNFRVEDMHCVNCAMRLQQLEDDLPGVIAVDASYRRQKMSVQFDETRVSATEIIAAAQRLGYTIRPE
mgnify:CR=1 FL=1